MRIDLHTHSSMSDGTDSPADLVAAADAAGLDVVALTDHDTTKGWAAATDALAARPAEPPSLTLVRGAEFSCVSPDGRGRTCAVHVLAYLFDPESPAITAEQHRLRVERRQRLRRMAEKMRADGLPIDPDEVMDGLPAGSAAGRPHLAMALQRAGLVTSVAEAFDRYLDNHGRYYMASPHTPVHDAIRMVDAAGGVTVLAHAFARTRGRTVTPAVIADLAATGLSGIEVDHPDHNAEARTELRGIAAELDLPVTGSSDYHGRNKSARLGQETTTPEMFERLTARATGVALVDGPAR